MDLLSSRYASCTPGVLDACVRAVAAAGNLERVIPDWSADKVALVARDVLEACDLISSIGDHLMRRDVRASDWALTVLADLRFAAARTLRDGDSARAAALRELGAGAIEEAAASSNRSPVLWYEDIYFEAAQSLVRRGDRMGLVRQIECVAEALRSPERENVLGTMRDLAFFHLDLGDQATGLGLLTGLQRHDPADRWMYNTVAILLGRHGLPSLARLAAERGLELLKQRGDPDRLGTQLRETLRSLQSATDRSDAPAHAVDELRDALRWDFDQVSSVATTELAARLVPEIATARVKELPSLLSAEALATTAARLRALMDGTTRASPRGSQASARSSTSATQTRSPKVGRNDPCACGSGKKFKACCR